MGVAAMEGLSLLQLNVLCADWQARLRLQDWDVHLHVVQQAGLNPDTHGHCHYHSVSGHAVIRLLHPAAYVCENGPAYDMEETLVHELLHLTFAGCTPEEPSAEDTAMELGINRLARALVTLKREKGEP